MKMIIVIPARLASTRLPEKLLLKAGGKSILQHTVEAASKSTLASEVIVAVDDPRLASEVESFGGQPVSTSVSCQSGTDRLAEIAATREDVDIFINVQGDEPEMNPAVIDAVAGLLQSHPDADIATAATPIRSVVSLNDPNCVKVIMGGNDRAVTFTRASVPYVRDGLREADLNAEPPHFWHHLGIYAYRRDFLLWFAGQPPGRLEQLEKLEQLRAIEAGKTIVVAPVASASRGIDTPADFEAFCGRLALMRLEADTQWT